MIVARAADANGNASAAARSEAGRRATARMARYLMDGREKPRLLEVFGEHLVQIKGQTEPTGEMVNEMRRDLSAEPVRHHDFVVAISGKKVSAV
jgi:hypothetical protein